MDEASKRQEAIRRLLLGETLTKIANSLKKSRKWIYFWKKRFEQDPNGRWFIAISTAPRRKPSKIKDFLEQQIILIRKRLEDRQYSQNGAIAIQYEFISLGLDPPDVWTINRIIRRHKLHIPSDRHKHPKEYPELFIHTHQMDLVGPRSIKGDGHFYSINIIDITTHSCHVRAIRTKTSSMILAAIAEFWQLDGMPDALQMDNELAFRGSNTSPHSFGKIIRFALSQGVAIVFIPFSEPWRNGMIEKFNNTYDKQFYRPGIFNKVDDVIKAEKLFCAFHNAHHRYSSQGQKSPDEMNQLMMPTIKYNGTAHLDQRIPLTKGVVYFIRFIRGDLKLKMPNETFLVKSELKYSYVVAEVNIYHQSLDIRQDLEIVQSFPYPVPVDW